MNIRIPSRREHSPVFPWKAQLVQEIEGGHTALTRQSPRYGYLAHSVHGWAMISPEAWASIAYCSMKVKYLLPTADSETFLGANKFSPQVFSTISLFHSLSSWITWVVMSTFPINRSVTKLGRLPSWDSFVSMVTTGFFSGLDWGWVERLAILSLLELGRTALSGRNSDYWWIDINEDSHTSFICP